MPSLILDVVAVGRVQADLAYGVKFCTVSGFAARHHYGENDLIFFGGPCLLPLSGQETFWSPLANPLDDELAAIAARAKLAECCP